MIFFAAGDPGGSRSLLPIIRTLASRGEDCLVLDHGYLGREIKVGSSIFLCSKHEADKAIASCSAFVFGSSATDVVPLTLARRARILGRPIAHVIDNWGGYMSRLRTDRQEPLIPDLYVLPDEEARQGCLAEGLPPRPLEVIGHPAMAGAASELKHLRAANSTMRMTASKQVLAFIQEPFRMVFGDDLNCPGHPGFIGESVLACFAEALSPWASEFQVIVLAHPKQDIVEQQNLWETVRGPLQGRVLKLDSGRDILGMVSGLAGMASSLLYESWMIGLPTLVMQPDLKMPSLQRMGRLDGVFYARSFVEIFAGVNWLVQCSTTAIGPERPELRWHEAAPEAISDKILKLAAVAPYDNNEENI